MRRRIWSARRLLWVSGGGRRGRQLVGGGWRRLVGDGGWHWRRRRRYAYGRTRKRRPDGVETTVHWRVPKVSIGVHVGGCLGDVFGWRDESQFLIEEKNWSTRLMGSRETTSFYNSISHSVGRSVGPSVGLSVRHTDALVYTAPPPPLPHITVPAQPHATAAVAMALL